MKKTMFILMVLGMIAIMIGTYSLLTWGIGSLFVCAFNIQYEWTFLKSLSVVLVAMLFIPYQLKGEINFDKERTN